MRSAPRRWRSTSTCPWRGRSGTTRGSWLTPTTVGCPGVARPAGSPAWPTSCCQPGRRTHGPRTRSGPEDGGPMSQEALIADRIRRGQGPDPAAVTHVAAADVARLGDGGVKSARSALAGDVLGLGPLEACVGHPDVTDVLVNGDGSVWLDRGSGGLQRADVD